MVIPSIPDLLFAAYGELSNNTWSWLTGVTYGYVAMVHTHPYSQSSYGAALGLSGSDRLFADVLGVGVYAYTYDWRTASPHLYSYYSS